MKVRSVDQAMDVLDRYIEDQRRKLTMALLVDAPADGATVDFDAIDRLLDEEREWIRVWRERAQQRLQVMFAGGEAEADVDDPRRPPSKTIFRLVE